MTSDREDGVTTVTSQFGVMAHNSGSIVLEKGTIFNTKNAAFLIKSGTVDISVDDLFRRSLRNGKNYSKFATFLW